MQNLQYSTRRLVQEIGQTNGDRSEPFDRLRCLVGVQKFARTMRSTQATVAVRFYCCAFFPSLGERKCYVAMRILSTLALILFLTFPVCAQDEEREVALPFVTLVQPPKAPKLELTPLSEERIQEIEELIGELTKATRKDIEINSGYGSDFVPTGRFGTFGDWTGEPLEGISDPVRRLIETGPDALPYLLKALDDNSRTEIVIECVENRGAIAGGMAFDVWTHGNPVNPTENHILRLSRHGYSPSIRPKNEFALTEDLESYRVKVGDVAYVIIGQIVGRNYVCLGSPHVKSLGVLVVSPVRSKKLREQIRSIWKTENPKQKLLESLMLDYSTRGILQWESLDFWDIGNDFQIESTKRLLYYYPDVAVPLLVERIGQLQASDDFVADCVHNGLRSDNFVDSIAWSKNETIKTALAKLAKNAKENDLIRSLQRAGVETPKQ